MSQSLSLQARLFAWFTSAAGTAVVAYALFRLLLDLPRFDCFWLLLALQVMLWQTESRLPAVSSKISLADFFVYIAALLLGPWAAAVIAAIAGATRFPQRRASNRVANAVYVAATVLSALGASLLATVLFGPLPALAQDGHRNAQLALAALSVGMVHFHLMLAFGEACRAAFGFPFDSAFRSNDVVPTPGSQTGAFRTWAILYLKGLTGTIAGLAAAAGIVKGVALSGFTALVVLLPVTVLVYLTYRIHRGKVETSHQHIANLAKLHLATIESLTLAIDAKDPLTRGHIQRVRVLAEGLARAVGYSEEQMEGLKAAALLHDIGKLAVPEHILSKPGKLSSAEYSKIMIHPVVGADILSNVEFPYEVVPIVKHHHERFDGSGYPAGLRGEEIPFGARILTVVDCYDALTTNRPYRQRFTRAEAIEVMRSERGRTFDPAILEKFIAIVDTLEDQLPAPSAPSVSAIGVEPFTTGQLLDYNMSVPARSRAEKALRDITAAQREVLSLYEIAQTLGSALKLSEVLPIVATKLEHIANFTTLVIYLTENGGLRAAYAIGKNAQALKGMEMRVGEGGAGWVAEHQQVLIGGSPLADLERTLGGLAASYRSTAIFPLMHDGITVGALALYCEEDSGYSTDELRLLETIAAHAAAAVHNALAFERTQESALTDSLTGLPNSRYMYSFFDQERSRAERHGYALVLMMMDLDGFKKINDTYGHHVGDEILRRIAQTARAQVRSGDILIRYAGDEFVAILHRATPEVVADLKTRLQGAVDHCAFEVRPGRVARVGISIGSVTYGVDGTAIDELMEIADQRMYEDKAARKQTASAARLATFPTRMLL